MKKLHFTQIVSSGHEGKETFDICDLLEKRTKKIVERLKDCVVTYGPIRSQWWDDGEIQYRRDFIVSKPGRKPTWNEVYQIINQVKPVPFNLK